MKLLSIIPLLFLVACSTSKPPKLAVRPQEPPPTNDRTVRYPEVTRAYHLGRYADPNDSLILHEQHVVYRVESRPHWNFHPGPAGLAVPDMTIPPRDAAFAPLPVNDAILAEVNAQKATTTAVMTQAKQLSGALNQFQSALGQAKANVQETAALRMAVTDLAKRLELLEAKQQFAPAPTSSEVPANLSPPPEP